jgi:hypothetical protein
MFKMNRLLQFLLFAALPLYNTNNDGGGGGGGGGENNPPAPKNNPPEPETFSREYVRELREENKAWRLRHQQAKDEAEKAAKDAETATSSATKTANDRILRAELKAAAIAAGMVDLDGLKLADLSKVTLKEDGTVEGAEALMDEMKKAKPYLFGTPNSSSSQHTPPGAKTPEAKKATEMTEAEYAEARKQFR